MTIKNENLNYFENIQAQLAFANYLFKHKSLCIDVDSDYYDNYHTFYANIFSNKIQILRVERFDLHKAIGEIAQINGWKVFEDFLGSEYYKNFDALIMENEYAKIVTEIALS